MGKEKLEEGLDILKVIHKDRVIHTPLAHKAARHQEAVLYRVAYRAGQFLSKGCPAKIVEAVPAAAVSNNGDLDFGAQEARRKEHGVRAAGNVQGAVRIISDELVKLVSYLLAVIDVSAAEDNLHLKPAMPEKSAELIPNVFYITKVTRADIDYTLRLKHFSPKYVFQRSFIEQLNQCLHFLSPHECE
jgi:hypothetical protein